MTNIGGGRGWRRKLRALAMLAVFAIAAAGCSSTSSANGGPVTLTVWSWGSTTKTLKKLEPGFEKANPGVKVKFVDQPLNSYPTLLNAAIASGQGPDIVQTYGSPNAFDYQNGLLPLRGYVTPEQKKNLIGWPAVSTGLSSSGTPYAVPYLSQGFVWYYNKKLFKKAGLDPNNPPTTWSDFLAACGKLKAAGITPIVAGFQDGYLGEDYMGHFAAMLMTPKQLAAARVHPDWTNPAYVKAWTFIRELYEKGYFTPSSQGVTLFPQAANEFGAGKGAMFYGLGSDTANFAQFKPTLGGDLGAWLGPNVPGSQYRTPPPDFSSNLAWGITKWSAYPKQAYAWISYVTSAKSEETGFETLGSLPNNKQAAPKTSYAPAREVIQQMKSPDQITNPDFMIRSEVETTLDRVVPEILTGQVSAQTALQQVQQAQSQVKPIPAK